MADTAVLNRDEILEKTRGVLMEALVVDADEVTPDASLTADLEAESIDFLDIVFRLEKEFSTPDKPFKIEQGELFPDNLLENPAWFQGNKFTDEGMAMLRERMPHVDFSAFDEDRELDKVGATITVSAIVDFVDRKLTA